MGALTNRKNGWLDWLQDAALLTFDATEAARRQSLFARFALFWLELSLLYVIVLGVTWLFNPHFAVAGLRGPHHIIASLPAVYVGSIALGLVVFGVGLARLADLSIREGRRMMAEKAAREREFQGLLQQIQRSVDA